MDVIINHNHSRVPVYQGSIDNIIGILYAKDLLKVLREKGREAANQIRLPDIVRPAAFAPESKKVNELFEEMQKRRIHMAIVIDEYGGTAGIVTIEDILEEIVGEIADEYDDETPPIERLDENTARVTARLSVEDLAHLFDLDLPERDD